MICIGLIFAFSINLAEAADQKDGFISSFGSGAIKVRLYADYFCGPCSRMEPKADPIVNDLVKKSVVNITFIDAPFHKFSSLYTKYFLFILNEKKNFNYALSARSMLFDAAKESQAEREKIEEHLKKKGIKPKPFDPKPIDAVTENLIETEKIEEYLKKRKIKFKPFDVKPVFSVLERFMREDNIDSTPACVIEREGKKEVFKGVDDVLKALESLKTQ